MIVLISLALTGLLVRFCGKSLKQRSSLYYLIAVLAAAIVVGCTYGGVSFSGWVGDWVWPIFSRGALASALFILVMWMGALPNGSSAIKTLMPLRGELSILACILTLGHNIAYGKTYFRLLFTRPDRLPANQLSAALCSLVMIVIMLPLFVTSFKRVRRRMNGKSWKKLQRLAYLFYDLMYVHVMLLNVPYAMKGRVSYVVNVLVYSAIFLSYAICRLLKHSLGKTPARLLSRQKLGVAAALAVSVCLTAGIYAAGGSFAVGDGSAAVPSTPVQSESTEPNTLEDEPSGTAGYEPSGTPEEPASSEAPSETPDVVDQPDEPAVSAEPSVPAETQKPVQTTQPSPSAEPTPSAEPPAEQPSVAPEPEPEPEPEPVRIYKNGSFTGTGEGFLGDITVSVTIQDDVITAISVTAYEDDEPYISNAKGIVGRMLSAQSADVDVVSGATFSSEGIIEAVKAALSSAKN